MEEDRITFKSFCKEVKRLVLNPVDDEELHERYVMYKKDLKHYEQTPEEFIKLWFEDRTLDTHTNILKSKHKPFPNYCEGAKCKIENCSVCKNQQFTKRFHNLDVLKLEYFNRHNKKSNSIKDRIYRNLIRSINKRNNYTP